MFLDPPYRKYADLYGCADIADEVEAWSRDNAQLRIALCGLAGDYDLPGWDAVSWDRGSPTYGSSKTAAAECIWLSPACEPANPWRPITARRSTAKKRAAPLDTPQLPGVE